MRKLIQAYTDESGQVVVDPELYIKVVQEADRIYILAAGTLTMLDLASKNVGRVDRYPSRTHISSEWGMVCHSQQETTLHLYQIIW